MRLAHDELADVAVAHHLKRLAVMLVGAGLEIHEETSFFAVARLPESAMLRQPGASTAMGFEIDVLARLHGGGGLLRMKIRRRLNDHRVEFGFEQPLVADSPV